jgi:hypothetical protein
MSSFTNAGLVLPEFKIKLKVVASAFVFSGIETVLPVNQTTAIKNNSIRHPSPVIFRFVAFLK